MSTVVVEQGLRDLVAELAELEPAHLGVDTSFAEVGIDSLMALEIAVHVERLHGVRFEDADIARIRTLRDLVALVHERGGPGAD